MTPIPSSTPRNFSVAIPREPQQLAATNRAILKGIAQAAEDCFRFVLPDVLGRIPAVVLPLPMPMKISRSGPHCRIVKGCEPCGVASEHHVELSLCGPSRDNGGPRQTGNFEGIA